MRNSWCKVVDGKIEGSPRAWPDNMPPDDSWWPHFLIDPSHTINDKFDGPVFSVDLENRCVNETNMYSPKSSEQIQAEVNAIKQMAADNVAAAVEALENEDIENREAWEEYKTAWEQLLDITELSWDYHMPSHP
jgi:hypothetical protein